MVDLVITGGSQTLDGTLSYGNVTITNGGILYITPYNGTGTTGTLILNVSGTVTVDATSSINGAKRGYLGGTGSGWGVVGKAGTGSGAGTNGGPSVGGTGVSGAGGGGGSGYGTTGAAGGNGGIAWYGVPGGVGGSGGPAYGTSSGTDIAMGSGAGGGGSSYYNSSSAGEPGGAMLTINANTIYIRGTLNFSGGNGGIGADSPAGNGSGGGGGGASGGGIKLVANSIDISNSTISTAGGNGGNPGGVSFYDAGGPGAGGGPGGGGRIKIYYGSLVNTGTTITTGTIYYAATSGSASFTSSPSVARIWIDGVDKGVNTPSTISGLTTGSHGYTLKLAGYLDATGSFSVTAGSTIAVPLVTLTLATGSASFTSSPSGARIWIDTVDKGVNTPSTIAGLSIGSRNYTLKLAGYQDATGTFSISGGITTTVPLVTFLASTYFTSTPTGATIWIDDISRVTVTPATVVGLTAGAHTYRLIKIGYTNRGSFSTTAGTTTNVSATLTAVGLNGSIWVENQYLCYINASNVTTYVVGTSSGVVAGLPGSVWVEGTQLAYIDSTSNKRLLPVTTLSAVAGSNGSMWIDGNYLYYIASGIQRYVTI